MKQFDGNLFFKDVSAVFIKSCHNQHTHPICIITGIILPDLFSLGNQDIPYRLALLSRSFSFSQVGICDRSLKGTILYTISRWWFQIFLYFQPIFKEDVQVEHILSDGLVQPPTGCNMKLKNAGLEDDFPFQLDEFEVLAVNLQGCTTCVPYC